MRSEAGAAGAFWCSSESFSSVGDVVMTAMDRGRIDSRMRRGEEGAAGRDETSQSKAREQAAESQEGCRLRETCR